MKNIAIIIPKLSGGGAERIGGLLSQKLSGIYNVYLFLYDIYDNIYDYGGTIVNLSINGSEYIDHYLEEYKRKYKIDCAISFLDDINFSNIRTRGDECVIISERCAVSSIDPPDYWIMKGIRSLYHYADKIISVSHGVQYDLVKNFGIDKNLITTIYNFIDTNSIYEKMNKKLSSDVLSFVGESRVILNIGRLHEQKNQKTILVQFRKLLFEEENIKLIIMGAGAEIKQLQALIKALQLDKFVMIVPYGKNPFSYYKLASLFVLASKYEGLPNVLLESMICKTPIVAVDCLAGPRELLNDEVVYDKKVSGYKVCKRGVLVEQAVSDELGETEYLKEAMQLVLNSENLRKKLIESGSQYIEQYSNEKILDVWVNVIENTQRKIGCFKEIEIMKEPDKNIIVYGAGKFGKTIIAPYLSNETDYDLLCFAVSNKEENPREICGIPVFGIEELVQYKENATVLIGVSQQYQSQVLKILDIYGFKKVVYPSLVKLDYRYYSRVCVDKYEEELTGWYRIHTERKLDWNNLRTYNEKLQWLKLYDQTKEKQVVSDKFLVRDFVRKKIGDEYLLPLFGCWDFFDEIEFEKLPDEFMLKCTHGRGWNIAVYNKAELGFLKLKEQFDSWMMLDYAFCSGFDLNYRNMKRRIIAEQILYPLNGEELRKYNVFVFDGNVKIIQVDIGAETDRKRILYTRDWEYLPYGIGHPIADNVDIIKPDCLEKIIVLSETLGAGFRHVRVDFYVIDDRIYFDEMTFVPGKGTEKFTSEKFALEMGSWITLSEGKFRR